MAGPVYVLDDYYLAITLLVTIAYQLIFFSVAFTLKFDKLTDFAGGTNFALLAALTLAFSSSTSASHNDDDDGGGGGSARRPSARQIVASLLLIAWALRLAGFLLFRVLRTGRDARFDDKRDRFLPFLGFWVFQMLWVWAVSLPVTVLNSPAVQQQRSRTGNGGGSELLPFGTARDVAGVVLFALGFAMESVSDAQRFVFRERGGSDRDRDRAAVLDRGLFYLSRHPNYFGEIILQFGIYTLCVSEAADGPVGGQAASALYATVVGPVFLTALLLFVSGLPLSERPGAKKRYEQGLDWEAYARYLRRTSVLIPFPPRLYERVPVLLKRTLFLEFPMYVFDPAKHADGGPRAAEEERARDAAEARGDTAGARQSGERLTG
ncbi:hypothetical protein F5X96DRAFT_645580 [Biscogniauxia mediterranea]|nr:hypothetical protein F5X96DRAFT_645580 [Biscogniauxia mediterranea]